MDLLKKNGFWIVLGAIALCEILIYFLLVMPEDTAIGEKIEELEGKVVSLNRYAAQKDIRTTKWQEHFKDKKSVYEDQYAKALAFYKTKDQVLERFFDEVKKDAAGKPDTTDFATQYRDKFDRALVDAFRKTVPIEEGQGKGFQDDRVTSTDGIEKISRAQKHYWIQAALAEAMKKAGVRKLGEVKFEDEEPGEIPLYRKIPVSVTMEIPLPQISILVAETLKSPLIVRIRGLKVGVVDKFAIADDVVMRDVPEKDMDPATVPDDVIVPEPSVQCVLTCEILDFDIP